ncbi:MAG: hypothetical protein WD335_01435 [Candidatus Paceibacterota bacterium]
MSKKNKETNKNSRQIQFVWGLLCKLSSIDQEKNNISLFNVIDQLNLPKKVFSNESEDQESVSINHELVMVFRRVLPLHVSNQKIQADCKITLIDPKGEELQEVVIPLVFKEKSRRSRMRIRTNGILISSPGSYVYKIEVRNPDADNFHKMGEIPLEVLSVQEQDS